MQAGNVIGTASFVPTYKSPDAQTGLSDNVTPFWMIGGAGVEVEVDTETGHVRVTKLVNAADCGKPINPGVARTQLSPAPRSCSSASPCPKTCGSTAAR